MGGGTELRPDASRLPQAHGESRYFTERGCESMALRLLDNMFRCSLAKKVATSHGNYALPAIPICFCYLTSRLLGGTQRVDSSFC